MKQKHFILALVAMLWSVSVSAQTTVTTETELREALTDGGEFTLGADIEVTEMIVVPAGVTATLDLNGQAITVPEATDRHIYAIDNQGILTLKDGIGGGSITARGIYNGYNGNAENAKLIVESGKYVAIDTNGGAAIFNGAELVINGGEFYGGVAAVNGKTATSKTTINGGTFGGAYDGNKSTSYIIQSEGTLVINYAEVVSGFGAVGCFGGTTVIKDGKFNPTGWAAKTCHVVYVDADATVDIQGGTFMMNYPADAVPDSGSAVASYYNGTLTISGGSFTAHFDNVSPVELSSGSEITGGSFYNHAGAASTHSYVTNYIKEGYELNQDGLIKATFVAKIGTTTYKTLEAAFAAAVEGETITLLADATPVLTSQRAITKAAVIDLGGKTLTLTEDDLYFGTTTFMNGTIVVAPSVKASTAVFWMFENQTLTFDNVDIVATGVTGTYLIGINGGTGSSVNLLNGSSITMDNTSTTGLTAVICDNGTGNTVTIENSAIAVNNIEGRFYLGGSNGTVSVENTSVELNGVKEGFYLRAGQSLDIAGTSTVDIILNSTEGRYGINVTDASASYTKAETAAVNASVYSPIPAVAQIGTTKYTSLQEAIEAAQATETVTLLADITLAGGYDDAAEALRIEKAITIKGEGHTIDCGNLRKGIRVYNNGTGIAVVRFENVTIKNDAAGGRCIDTRTSNIALTLSNATLIAEGTNSQPLTIGGGTPAYSVTMLGTTINAGKSGYGVISFVPVQAGITAASNTMIEGMAAFYLTSDASNTKLNLGHGTYTGTNLYPVESGSFGAVVVEGNNNTITMNNRLATIKAVAGDGAAQAAFNVRGAGNTVQIAAEGAQVIAEGAQAYRAIVKSDVAASTKMIDNGAELGLVAESNGVQFYSFEEAIRFVGNEGTIKLIGDAVLENTWTVAAGQNITLDLNGKTASMVYIEDATANHAMILNNGDLTIESSVEGGKLSYIYTGANLGTSKSVNTITSGPGSVLTVKSGTIENLTYEQATIAYAIDGLTNGGLGDVTVNIEGGVITSKRQAVRIFANSTTNTGTLNICGGELTGRVIVQNANAKANLAVLNITDGTFNANDYKTDVLYVGGSQNATIDIEATVAGGTFNGEITETHVKGFISGGTYQTAVAEDYCILGYQPVQNENGTYTVEYTGKVSEFTIVDGELTEYVNEQDIEVGVLTYERTLPLVNVWMPLYVPFAIPMSDEFLANYDIAYFYDVHGYDDDDDNVVDRTTLELIKITDSEKVLKANYPLLIRAKNEDAKNLQLTLNGATLCKAEENAVTVNSVSFSYEVKGTYQTHSSLADNQRALGRNIETGNAEWIKIASGYSLNPFRLILTIESRGNDDLPFQAISMRVIGEENHDGTTAIYGMEYDEQPADCIYDLQGRRVLEPQKGGLYIVNGKKVVF